MGCCQLRLPVGHPQPARPLVRLPPPQVQHNAHLLPELKEAAAEALRGMDRKPVADLTF